MEPIELYLEYEIHENRPGLLGDVASLLGMMGIDIMTINGVENRRRGMLLLLNSHDASERLESVLQTISNIRVTKFRKPNLRDRLAVRHGRYIQRDADDRKTFRFVRSEVGILVDFLAEIVKPNDHKLIGIRGMPRVGKTESIIAASVSASKRWVFLSSTLLKQTIRSQLSKNELDGNHVYIIDGVVSIREGRDDHWQVIRDVMQTPAPKIIEHPDYFIAQTRYTFDDFDYMIELRHNHDETISYSMVDSMDEESSPFDFN